jgi:hypothetical protein
VRVRVRDLALSQIISLSVRDTGHEGDTEARGNEVDDPRNRLRKKKSRARPPAENLCHVRFLAATHCYSPVIIYQTYIRRFLCEKGLLPPSSNKKEKEKRPPEQPSRPTMPPSVDAVILEAYCRRIHPGPNPDHMPFSWDNPVDHPWNQAVVQLLTTQFKKNVKDCRYQKMTSLPASLNDGTRDFVANAIRKKLARRQNVLRIVMRKLNNFPNLSDFEFADMLAKHQLESHMKGRRYERRRNVRFHPIKGFSSPI